MKHLNEKHTWFNLDKNTEDYILRYTTIDKKMIDNKFVEKILENNTNNKVTAHKYGVIVFKEPLTSIGSNAFYGCSGLTSITIPNSVTRIEMCAFYKCSGLTSITIPNSVKNIGGYAFVNCIGLSAVTIPNSVTRIEGCAFQNCTGLTSVTIPNSVARLGNDVFRGCINLTNITYKGTKTLFNAIGDIIHSFPKGVNIHCTDGDIII